MNERFERMVIELEDAKAQMIEAKRRIRSDAEREAKRVAALNAADQIEQVEVEFARKLADAHAAGIPQAVLRSQVLRTNDWATWTKWRDMADIPLERSPRAGAADKPMSNPVGRKSGKTGDYEWNDDYTMLTVFHVPKVGVRAAADLPRPVVFVDWSTVDRVQVFTSDRVFRAIGEYRSRVIPFANDLVSAAVKEGLIPSGVRGRLLSSDARVVMEHDAESDRLNAGWLE